MPVVEDELWKNPGNPGMIVITSHASVDEHGRLFLGYGIAKEAVRRIPDIEIQCGEKVLSQSVDGVYGFLPVRFPRPQEKIVGFGIFQTRYAWDEVADPQLIKYSMELLRNFTQEHQNLKIRMNFPGVNSGLAVEEVAPLLIPLPPTVTICHQGEVRPTVPDSFPGFKTLYIQVDGMLQDGEYDRAIEHLMKNGFDIQSAINQVNAVQRLLDERRSRVKATSKKWRSSQFIH